MERTVEFTPQRGIEIQTQQLAEWKKKLKSNVYKDLKTFATKNNHLAKSGYDIVRGTDLDCFIANWGR